MKKHSSPDRAQGADQLGILGLTALASVLGLSLGVSVPDALAFNPMQVQNPQEQAHQIKVDQNARQDKWRTQQAGQSKVQQTQQVKQQQARQLKLQDAQQLKMQQQ